MKMIDNNEILENIKINGFFLSRGVDASAKDLVNLARSFGKPQVFIDEAYRHPKFEHIFVSNSRPNKNIGGMKRVGLYWHQDSSFTNKPLHYTMLYCMKAPLSGGETSFVNVREITKWFLKEYPKMSKSNPFVLHESYHRYIITNKDNGKSIQELILKDKNVCPPARHRMLRMHPITNEKLLYINEGFSKKILGVSIEMSSMVLDEIFKKIRSSKVVNHKWKKGDFLIWDNYLVNHRAYEVKTGHKLLYRLGVI